MAEAEFAPDEAAQSFRPRQATIAEVTEDPRFTGGTLAHTRRPDLLAVLAEYGINLQQTR